MASSSETGFYEAKCVSCHRHTIIVEHGLCFVCHAPGDTGPTFSEQDIESGSGEYRMEFVNDLYSEGIEDVKIEDNLEDTPPSVFCASCEKPHVKLGMCTSCGAPEITPKKKSSILHDAIAVEPSTYQYPKPEISPLLDKSKDETKTTPNQDTTALQSSNYQYPKPAISPLVAKTKDETKTTPNQDTTALQSSNYQYPKLAINPLVAKTKDETKTTPNQDTTALESSNYQYPKPAISPLLAKTKDETKNTPNQDTIALESSNYQYPKPEVSPLFEKTQDETKNTPNQAALSRNLQINRHMDYDENAYESIKSLPVKGGVEVSLGPPLTDPPGPPPPAYPPPPLPEIVPPPPPRRKTFSHTYETKMGRSKRDIPRTASSAIVRSRTKAAPEPANDNRHLPNDDVIAVDFIILLSRDIKFDVGKDKLWLQSGNMMSLTKVKQDGILAKDSLQLIPERRNPKEKSVDKFILFKGRRLFNEKDVIGRIMHYMYIVEIEGCKIMEYIFFDEKDNWVRCLTIPPEFRQKGVWKQYDWPIRLRPGDKPKQRWFTKVRQVVTAPSSDESLGHMVVEYLPKWSGFCVEEQGHSRSSWYLRTADKKAKAMPAQALEQTEQVQKCLSDARIQMIHSLSELWTHEGFSFNRTLVNFVSARIDKFSKKRPGIPQILSALAICYLADQGHESIALTDRQYNKMWKGLLIPSMFSSEYQELIKEIKESFGSYFQSALNGLENQCKAAVQKARKNGRHKWLLALPLLHFLREDIQPLQPPPAHPKDDHLDPSWWGLIDLDIEESQWLLQADASSSAQICDIMKFLSGHFAVDQFLPLCFMWLLRAPRGPQQILSPIKEKLPKNMDMDPYISICAMHAVLGKIQELTKTRGTRAQHWNLKNLECDIQQLDETVRSSDPVLQSRLGLFLRMSASVTQWTLDICDRGHYTLVINVFRLLESCFNMFKMYLLQEEVFAGVPFPLKELQHWLKQNLPKQYMDFREGAKEPRFKDEAKIWAELMAMGFPPSMEQQWRPSLMQMYKDRANNTLSDFHKVVLSQQKYQTGCKDLDDIFHLIAMKAITDISEDFNRGIMKPKNLKPFGDLLSELLANSYPNVFEDETKSAVECFQRLFEWESLTIFLNFSDTERQGMFDQSSNQRLTQIINIIQNRATELIKGEIKLQILKLMLKDNNTRQRFLKMYKSPAIDKTYQSDDDSRLTVGCKEMEKLLVVREKELRTIEGVYSNIKNYVTKCVSLQTQCPGLRIDTGDLHAFTRDADVNLMALCTPVKHTELPNKLDSYEPIVTILQDPNIEEVLEPLSILVQLQSRVFEYICNQQVNAVARNRRTITVEETASEIWMPAIRRWNDVRQTLLNGSITCQEVEHYFANLNADELKAELTKFCPTGKVAQDRGNQMEKYFHLRQRVTSASTMLRVIDVLGFHRAVFGDVVKLANMATGDNQPLSEVSTSRAAKVAKVLPNIDAVQHNCIIQLTRAPELVKWIRAKFRGHDRDQLRNFIDIMTASGIDDIQLAAIASFRQAVDGYAPLILELGDNVSLQQLVDACNKVWRNLLHERDLPNAMNEANKQLPWLQQAIGESQSSIESAAFHQAELINTKGVYTLGVCENGQTAKVGDSQIQLTVRNIHGDRQDKIFSLNDLQDLQSKLMLLSSEVRKDKEQITRHFEEILTAVQQIEEIRTELSSEGCLLFQDWRTEVHCNPNIRPSVIVGLEGVISIDSADKYVTEALGVLRDFLVRCRTEWRVYLEDKRREYVNLNNFTTVQLTSLRRDLARHNGKAYGNDNTAALLESVNRNSLSRMISQSRDHNHNIWAASYKRIRLDGSLRDIQEKCNSLWRYYIENLPNRELGNVLSIDQLGRILASIEEKVQYNRPFECDERAPNLILCPAVEVYMNVLKLYNFDDKPLPTSEEVLLCNPDTSLEEVEILLRRCMADQARRVFCLVNPDRLDHKIGVGVTKRLEEMIRTNTRREYRLVLLSSKENQATSHIVTAMSRYQRDIIWLDPGSDLKNDTQRYLQQKMWFKSRPLLRYPSVQVISSERAGIGKSEEIQYRTRQLRKLGEGCCITVTLHDKIVDVDGVVASLRTHMNACRKRIKKHIIHLDISVLVQQGLDDLLFNLLVLGRLTDNSGSVWRRRDQDHYFIEMTQFNSKEEAQSFYHMLPTFKCITPRKLTQDQQGANAKNTECVQELLSREPIQWSFQYLETLDKNGNLDMFTCTPQTIKSTIHQTTSRILENLRRCGINDPSWTVLRNFSSFLMVQMQNCEKSTFCKTYLTKLYGFKKFVITFMRRMAEDFSTPSLYMSEERIAATQTENDLEQFQLQRRWESRSHPYIFFNEGVHGDMTFWSFVVNEHGSLVDPVTPDVILERDLIPKDLLQKLRDPYGIQFMPDDDGENFSKLCKVLGVTNATNPDLSYKLTSDNVKKIMAIHMRFRCDIPVIIMGETGCGKTRLIQFMCTLQARNTGARNLILKKVHGGTSVADILQSLRKAEKRAKSNKDQYKVNTVLFFDEANTTEAIGLIKEIMCDGRAMGQPIDMANGALKIIAACNPYRRHTPQMIRHLNSAGLGYHESAENTKELLGSIPLRELVYRVQPLPPSMLDLVWDFGQLSVEIEKEYITRMVDDKISSGGLKASKDQATLLSSVLYESQKFMKGQQNECSFVSLRDVERCLRVLVWFQSKMAVIEPLLLQPPVTYQPIPPMTRSMILALGVCYHAGLQEARVQYRQTIARIFRDPCPIPEGAPRILYEISSCQDTFLNELRLGQDIARNHALKENVFMMIVCIELRIPLFLVGKPGSSKSLAKTVVADAMRGISSESDLFRQLKRIQMISFQCSPHATPEGIKGTFNQAAKLQQHTNLNDFTSVVVLDEVGLAEGSPKMPLKTLHPLLETGSEEDDDDKPPEKYMKVAFVGISNWALDPAKMNRGILLSREEPDEQELIDTAIGICSSDTNVLQILNGSGIVEALTNAYRKIYNDQQRKYFGLRDYYSLIKMITGFCRRSKKRPTLKEVEHAVRRNFDWHGSDRQWATFEQSLNAQTVVELVKGDSTPDPDCSSAGLLRASLEGNKDTHVETRYLLLETENYSALPILLEQLLGHQQAKPIFGSSFPYDQEYAQVCRNINRIKVCMETGRTVVLLNLENLYESLYDALNQYYVRYAGQRYVDLGLGTHRVKCRVHQDFRLIVIANSDKVRKSFPTPLLNRLEKHFLATSSLLTDQQQDIVTEIREWLNKFVRILDPQYKRKPNISNVIVGYHEDAVPSLVYHECAVFPRIHNELEWKQKITQNVQNSLLQCALPDAVIRIRKSQLQYQADPIFQRYFHQQKHASLSEYLIDMLHHRDKGGSLVQVTTHSELLVVSEITKLQQDLAMPHGSIEFCYLHQYDREHHFRENIRKFFVERQHTAGNVLIVQYSEGLLNQDLITCASYCMQDERPKDTKAHIVFVIQLSRAGRRFAGFPGGGWTSVHIDDLRPSQQLTLLNISRLKGKTAVDALNDLSSDEFSRLVLSSLYKASAKIVDNKSTDVERIKIRYNTIKRKLERTSRRQGIDEKNLADVLRTRISALLAEWQQQRGVSGDQWLTNVALAEGPVQECGTFGKAVWQRLVDLVSPFLAEILAFCDTNGNVDFLDDQEGWRRRLWLEILADESLSPLLFVDTQHEEKFRNRVAVKNPGFDGVYFQGAIPFSWLLKENLEFLYNQSKEIKGTNNVQAIEERFTQLVFHSPWANILAIFVEARNFAEDFLQPYIQDFISMTCCQACKGEMLMAIQDVLLGAARKTKYWDINISSTPIQAIIAIHVAYHRLYQQLANYRRLNEAHPDIFIIQDRNNTPIDIKAMGEVMEQLKPTKSEFADSNSRLHWLNRIHRVKPAIEGIIEAATTDTLNQYHHCKALFIEQKHTWNKINLLRIYVENVEEDHVETSVAVHIWKEFRNDASMKTAKSLETLRQKVLSHIWNISQRCAASFFLEVISQMCFSMDVPPEQEVIEKLVDFATGEVSMAWFPWYTHPKQRSTEASISLQSSILQILLQHGQEKEVVRRKLIQFLLSKSGEKKNISVVFDFCLLYVFHMEAIHHRKVAQSIVQDDNDELEVKLAEVLPTLQKTKRWIDMQGLATRTPTIELLDVIAQARFGLTTAIHMLFSEETKARLKEHSAEGTKHEMRNLQNAIQHICVRQPIEAAQVFLIKTLFLSYGYHTLEEAKTQCPWIIPERFIIQGQTNERDPYVVYGERYQELRNAVGRVYTTGDGRTMKNLFKVNLSSRRQFFILLALYSEVGSLYSSANLTEHHRVKVQRIKETIDRAPIETQVKKIAGQIVCNQVGNPGCNVLILTAGTPSLHQSQSCMVIHCIGVLRSCSSNLLRPLITILTEPGKLTDMFLPTMPEDFLIEAQQALKEKGKFYTCSKGHPYMIGNCGRPWVTARCPTCNETIGGAQHNLVNNNQVAVMRDNTSKGHILGLPSSRTSATAVTERSLKPIANAILRILLHAVMIGAASIRNAESVRRSIFPNPANTGQFLWDHLRIDLRQLSSTCGRNIEECLVLVHLVLKEMTFRDDRPQSHVYSLDKKTSRASWECDFARAYINPVIQVVDKQLRKATDQFRNDDRFSSNPLVNFLYHQPTTTEIVPPRSLAGLITQPQMWQYRPLISIDSLRQSLLQQQESDTHEMSAERAVRLPLLDAFVAEEPVLPDIIKLQALLLDQYHRCIDSNEAKATTIEDFIADFHRAERQREVRQMVDNFKLVWNQLRRNDLFRQQPIEQQYRAHEVTDKSSLAYLLPSQREEGKCSTTLVKFMIERHNDFIGMYRRIRGVSQTTNPRSSNDVRSSDLIAFDTDKEILPLLYANCDYITEREGTRIVYDLHRIERQIEYRFVRSRTEVKQDTKCFSFREDTLSDDIFQLIRTRIPQERLTNIVKHTQLIADFVRDFPILCRYLEHLTTAIGFLSSTEQQRISTNKDMLICDYLEYVGLYGKDDFQRNLKGHQNSRLTHILDLWRILAVERATIMHNNRLDITDIFGNVDQPFTKQISVEHREQLIAVFPSVNVDVIITELYEYIVLNLKRSESRDMDVSRWKIRDVLYSYVEAKDDDTDEELMVIGQLPEVLLLENALHVWQVAVEWKAREISTGALQTNEYDYTMK